MTACFMRFYKRISVFIGLMALLSVAIASTNSIEVTSAELDAVDNAYVLNAEFDINLDKALEEAVNKGVALSFLVEFQIVKPRKYWFDDEIVTVRRLITLNFHALSRQYLVSYDNHQKSFETLDEALNALMHIEAWKITPKTMLEKGETYRAALLMRLDKEKLPKAIQVDAISSENWNLASEIYTWPFKEIK
jgi:hypothetical protein